MKMSDSLRTLIVGASRDAAAKGTLTAF